MEVAYLTGTIHTDFLKAVKVANDPTLLAKMGREGNLPLYEYLTILLGCNSHIIYIAMSKPTTTLKKLSPGYDHNGGTIMWT